MSCASLWLILTPQTPDLASLEDFSWNPSILVELDSLSIPGDLV
jgi:hypothetical protein